MKKLLIIALVLCCFGCTTKITNTLENENNKATSSFRAFNDERYVWESWTFSTNKVNKLK
jgi:hypothetical protein